MLSFGQADASTTSKSSQTRLIIAVSAPFPIFLLPNGHPSFNQTKAKIYPSTRSRWKTRIGF